MDVEKFVEDWDKEHYCNDDWSAGDALRCVTAAIAQDRAEREKPPTRYNRCPYCDGCILPKRVPDPLAAKLERIGNQHEHFTLYKQYSGDNTMWCWECVIDHKDPKAGQGTTLLAAVEAALEEADDANGTD